MTDDTQDQGQDGDSSSSVKVESNSLSNGGEPPKSSVEKPPTAAEVVGHWNDPQKTKTTVYGAHNLEKGDELVRREDYEEKVDELNARWAGRLEDAVKNERERFKTVIDKKICFYEELDRDLSDVEYGRFKELRKLRQKLRGEVENQGYSSSKQNSETEENA